MNEQKQENAKKQNKFSAVLKKIFVHDIGWKLLAIFSAAVLWALSSGLSGLL
ncbi:MAG: hypothetical protein J1F69_04420 [Clostridiales bacterium]|nr:hypothetical protein [Clostridiales bacterium]